MSCPHSFCHLQHSNYQGKKRRISCEEMSDVLRVEAIQTTQGLGPRSNAISCALDFLRPTPHDSAPIQCEAVLYATTNDERPSSGSHSNLLQLSGCSLLSNVGYPRQDQPDLQVRVRHRFESLCLDQCHLSVTLANAQHDTSRNPRGAVSRLNDGIAWARPIGKLPHRKKF